MNHESSECFDQADRWWGTTFWQPARSCRVRYTMQVSEYFFDHIRIFSAIAPGMALPPTSMWSNAGDDFNGAATYCARFNVDVEHPFEPLCPGHGCAALGGRLVWSFLVRFGFPACASLGRCHQHPILAMGCKYTRDSFASLLLTRAFGIPGALLRLRRNRTPSIAGSARKTCSRSRLRYGSG